MRTPSRVFAFAAVGALGLGCQLLTLRLLADAGVPVALATVAAVASALVHNFVWHRSWTWRDRPAAQAWPRQLARFVGFNGAVSVVGNVALTWSLAAAGTPLVAANLVAVACCSVANFLLADRAVFLAAALATLAAATPAGAAVLEPRTVVAWNAYVRATETRIASEEPRLAVRLPTPDEWRRLRAGETLLTERRTTGADGRALEIVDGAVHHWVGQVLVRDVRLQDLLAELQAPRSRRWTPAEVRSMRVLRSGDLLRVHMRVERDSVVDVTYDIEHAVRYTRQRAGHATSRSVATRIVQIDDAGTPQERARPEGNDLGFLWRLNAYWRYVEVEGGVLVECESLALSRHVPFVVRRVAAPLIDRVSRESLENTLRALRAGFPVSTARQDTR